MSVSTPSSSSKKFTSSTADWSNLEINDKKWLPLDVNIESISTVIRNLDLRHVNISNDPQLLDQIEHDKIFGFVCSTQKTIEFEDQTLFHKQWSFIPVRIENSALTIQILNLCAVNGKHREVTYGYLLEKYLRDSAASSKENCALMNSVYAITPISFAHNIAARDFPLPKNSKQQFYVFVCLGSTIALIGTDGLLYTFKQSNLPVKEFSEYLEKKLKCQVYTIAEDPFREMCRKLEDKKAELATLSNENEHNKSNCHLDESFTYEDLKELSALNEQIEDAESFELILDTGSSSTAKKTESNKPSSLKIQSNKVHQLEQEIRNLVKQIEDVKKIFPHIYWPQISDSDLYGSKEYLKFYAHYKKVIHVATPKLLKSYKFAPIRTPRTGESTKGRKRSGSTSSSIPEATACGTPKRRRSSRAFKEKQ